MIKKFLIISLFLFSILSSKGQENKSAEQVIETIIERLASTSDEELDFSEITADLEYFYETPLNLNIASIDDLEQLVLLNDFQIKNLMQYISWHGQLLTVYELQYIEGFNYPTIKLLLPFICVKTDMTDEQWSLKRGLKYGKNELFFRTISILQDPVGYENVNDSVLNANPNKYYPGNKHRVYTRYKFSYKNKLLWGITAEKDPGEQFFKGEQKYGFDFYSAHLQIKDIGRVKNLVVGDFQGLFGQGLIMWSYLSNSKSSYVMDIRKRGQGLRKYSSTDENAFLRGAGATVNFGHFDLTVFGSYKNKDASYQGIDTLDNESAFFSAFDNSGIHATPNQIAKKDAIREALAGGNLTYFNKNLKLGITGLAVKYDTPLLKDTSLYNQFDFQGQENVNVSADFQYLFKNIHFFGEAGFSQNGGYGILTGALLELTSQLRGAILYRDYSIDFQSTYGNSFAEGSSVRNEKGFYIGIEMLPIKRIKVAAYYDFFKFPWLKQQNSSPSSGNDYLVQVDFAASRKVNMYARIKSETKQIDFEQNQLGINTLDEEQKLALRYQLNYSINEKWQFRNRIELSSYNESSEKETGYLLYQDIIYRPIKIPLKISFRYAYFDTESYNTRIYTYESDILNVYSVPAVYDKGTRTYLMLNYSLGQNLTFWIRYSQTWYTNKTEIGSGLNEIKGDTKSEIKFQLRWKI